MSVPAHHFREYTRSSCLRIGGQIWLSVTSPEFPIPYLSLFSVSAMLGPLRTKRTVNGRAAIEVGLLNLRRNWGTELPEKTPTASENPIAVIVRVRPVTGA